MGTLKIEYEGKIAEFQPDQTVTIGRHPNCTIVVSDPTVSRHHLTVQFEQHTWTAYNNGSTGTFEHGNAVETLTIDAATTLHLGGPDGAPIYFEPERPPTPGSIATDKNITVSNNGTELTFSPGQVVTVGRDAECTLTIDEPTVSRRHLSIEYRDHAWVADDVSSSGTFAASKPITSMSVTEPITLCLGSVDGVQLGLWVATAPTRVGGSGSIDELVSSSVHTEFRALEKNVQTQGRTSPPWSLLLPFGAWWRSKRLRTGLPLFLLVVWIAPIAIATIYQNSETSLVQTAFPVGDYYAWSIYFGILWAVLIWALMRPGFIPIPAFLIVIAFIFVFERWWNIVGQLNTPDTPPNTISRALQVGLHEEGTKALAVIAVVLIYEFILHAPRLSIRGYMYLGALSGITFGVIESVQYMQKAYVQAANCIINLNSSKAAECITSVAPGQLLWRAVTDGFTHALWASISAFFIGLAVLHRRWAIQFILTGVAIAIVLHGVNDWLASTNKGWLQVAVVALSAFIAVGYAVSGNQIDRIIGNIETSSGARGMVRNSPRAPRASR